jgi:hypothetical protein
MGESDSTLPPASNDTFVFGGAFGSDYVHDFHQGEDTFEFQVAGVSGFGDLVVALMAPTPS